MKKLKDLKRKKTKEEEEETLKPNPYYYITYNPFLFFIHTKKNSTALFFPSPRTSAASPSSHVQHQRSPPLTHPTQSSHPILLLPLAHPFASSSNHHHQHSLLGSSSRSTISAFFFFITFPTQHHTSK